MLKSINHRHRCLNLFQEYSVRRFSPHMLSHIYTIPIFVCLSGGKYQFVLCYEYSCWRNDRINHTFHGQVTALIIIMLITNYLSGSGHTQEEMLLAFIGPSGTLGQVFILQLAQIVVRLNLLFRVPRKLFLTLNCCFQKDIYL